MWAGKSEGGCSYSFLRMGACEHSCLLAPLQRDNVAFQKAVPFLVHSPISCCHCCGHWQLSGSGWHGAVLLGCGFLLFLFSSVLFRAEQVRALKITYHCPLAFRSPGLVCSKDLRVRGDSALWKEFPKDGLGGVCLRLAKQGAATPYPCDCEAPSLSIQPSLLMFQAQSGRVICPRS